LIGSEITTLYWSEDKIKLIAGKDKLCRVYVFPQPLPSTNRRLRVPRFSPSCIKSSRGVNQEQKLFMRVTLTNGGGQGR